MCRKKNRSHKVEVKGLALEINTLAANTVLSNAIFRAVKGNFCLFVFFRCDNVRLSQPSGEDFRAGVGYPGKGSINCTGAARMTYIFNTVACLSMHNIVS